ncbi:MAG: M20/M25/M40 family metallo-hydrolase [Microbacteriaceae bacterium]
MNCAIPRSAAAATVIATLEATLGAALRERPDPVSGPAYLTPTMIDGGLAPNIVPDRCEILFDRRLSPKETPETALADLARVLRELHASHGIDAELEKPIVALAGLDTAPESPVVVAAEHAVTAVLGRDIRAGGVTYSTDACYLAGTGGLPCVVLGPGSIDQAHAAVEWVELDEVVASADIYLQLALEFDRLSRGD